MGEYLCVARKVDSCLDKGFLVSYLERVLSKDSRKMVNVLSFAEGHENKTKAKNSFGELNSWKASRVYK